MICDTLLTLWQQYNYMYKHVHNSDEYNINICHFCGTAVNN